MAMVIGARLPASKHALSNTGKNMSLHSGFSDANNRDFVILNKRTNLLLFMGHTETPYVPTGEIHEEEGFGPPLSGPCLRLCLGGETFEGPPLAF